MNHLRQYLSAERGRRARLARELGVTYSAVFQWEEKGVPASRVLDVERVTGISRHVLSPDVFGPQPEPVTEAAE